jgi:hypothetical protein
MSIVLNYHIYNPNSIYINNKENYYLIPFGHRCTSALAIKYASLRKFSLPFDWTQYNYPEKIKNVLENDFKDFIPDNFDSIFFYNKYDIKLAHFNKNISEGIEEYKRRIVRFNKIIKENKKLYFVFINVDYIYYEKYRDKKFNDILFSQMLDLEVFLKIKYPKINYTILYFNFTQHEIPKNSNIINIVCNCSEIFNKPPNDVILTKIRMFFGSIISNIFKLNKHH